MANPYSNPNLYFQIAPVDPSNWDLALKTLAYKQGQYDKNKMQIEDTMRNWLSIDIKKPEVKQRFANNIQNLVNEINATGATDFSDPNITNRIMTHIGQALDEPVMNAIQYARIVDREEAAIEELKKKNIALYSSINHQDMYMTKGTDGVSYNEWLNDGRDDTIFRGNIRYTPFSDYQKKVDDRVMELMKLNKDTEIEMLVPPEMGGDGIRTEKYKIRGLNENQLRQVVEYSVLTPDDRAQMAIDARAKYNWYQTDSDILRLQDDVTNFTTASINNVGLGIKKLELQLAREEEGTASYKKAYDDLERLKNNRAYYEKLGSDLQQAKSPQEFDVAATQIYSSQFSDSVVNKYASLYSRTFLGYGVDEYGKDARDYNFKVEKERAAAAERLRKADREQAPKGGVSDTYNYLVVPEANVFSEVEGGAESLLREETNRLSSNVYTTSLQYIDELSNIVSSSSDLDKIEEANGILAIYKTKLANKLASEGMTVVEALDILDEMSPLEQLTTYDKSGAIFYDAVDFAGGEQLLTAVSTTVERSGVNYYTTMTDNITKYNALDDAAEELYKEVSRAMIPEDQTAILENLATNEYTYIGKDGRPYGVRETLIQDGEVLDSNGAIRPGAKLTDSRRYKEIESTFIALDILDKYADIGAQAEGGYAVMPEAMQRLRELASINGERVEDISSLRDINISSGTSMNVSAERLVVDIDSKTGRILMSASTIPNKLIGSNRNLLKDGKFKDLYWGSRDVRDTEEYRKGIETIYGDMATRNVISVSSTTEEGLALVRLLNSSNNANNVRARTDKESDLQLRKNEDGSINIVQKIDRGRDLGHISIELGDFSMETLSQFPELINKVNFEKTKEIFTRQRVQNNPISTKPISYWSQSVPDKNAYSVTGNDATIMMMLRPNTAVQVVSQSLPNYVDMVQNVDPSFPSKLKSAVENSNRFYISATIENEGLGDVGVFTLREVDTNRIVYTLKEQNIKALDGNIQMLKQTPQILYTTMLMDIARVNYEVNSSPDRIILGLDPEFTNAYNKVFTTN